MFQTFRNAWKIPELKNRLLFTLAILVVYRLGSAIPVPFITGSALNQMFSNGNMLSYLDMMSGGALSRCTLFALGVTPYINASIIVQLLTVAIPALENMAKEADGQQKMQQITRYVGGVIALVMSLGYYFVIRNMGALKYVSGAAGVFAAVVIIATFVAGAQLITWAGEQIDDKGIGNGISLLIFASIVSNWSSLYTSVTGLLTRAAAGETRFYISLEDDLMRLFGGDRVSNLMDTLKLDEDTPIENRMITSTLESAQKKLEGRNFEIRKNVLKYDDVMNQQREIIYGQRRKVLDGEDISTEMHNMLRENIDSSCKQFLAGDVKDEWDFGALRRHYQGWLTTDADFHYTVADFDNLSQQGIADMLYDRGMQILQAKEVRYGAPVMRELERICLLKCVDRQWMDHIDNMDQLRQGIALRGYGQKDPVVEYRIEGFDMFDQMVDSIRESSVKMLLTIELRAAGSAPKREQVAKPTGEGFVPGNGAPGVKGSPKGQPVRVVKIGRNDPCPCGSGLKFKKCTCAQYHPTGNNGGEE